MTPLWLQEHSSYIDTNRSTTAEQITFNSGSVSNAALLKVPLVAAGALTDETPLTIEITVANDVSIAGADSDIRYGVSDGTNFIGFEAVDTGNYHTWAPCLGTEAKSGQSLTYITSIDRLAVIHRAITKFYPDQFVFTIKPDKRWGSCFTAHGGGMIKTIKYAKRLIPSKGLQLEVYKSHNWERVGIKYIKITVIKTDG